MRGEDLSFRSVADVLRRKEELDFLKENTSLEEGISDWASRLYKATFGRLRVDPEEFVKSWAFAHGVRGELATVSEVTKAVEVRIREVERLLKQQKESLDEGFFDVVKGTFLVLTKPVRWLAEQLFKMMLRLFKWSANHPLGRLAWAIFFSQVALEPFMTVLAALFPPLHHFAAFALFLWILYEIHKNVKLMRQSENIGKFLTATGTPKVSWDELYRRELRYD